MMKKKLFWLFVFVSILSACGSNAEPTALPTLDATVLQQTAVYQVTLDANLEPTQVPTQTLPPLNTWTPAPTLDRTRPPIQTPTPDIPCDMAAAGHPIDVTIPDGTIMLAGESFLKTWRLVNVGSCTWTPQYAVTHFSANNLGAILTYQLPQPVEPGQVIDVTVSMQAPEAPGVYQSNWMLSNASGELFGIGPNGDAPFWVKIEVVPSVTDTPQPTPTITPTPVVYLEGDATLQNNDQFDLDAGVLNPADVTDSDFVFQQESDTTFVLMTMNGTLWRTFGDQEPTFGGCVQGQMSGNAIRLTVPLQETYWCYRSSGGLPGWLLIKDAGSGGLSISFLAWSKP